MKICILAAGAGGMYCGSCMRDNVLAAALLRAGHRVSLVPLYTPLRTEAKDVSVHEVFFGGVNVYLQNLSKLFRHTPRVFDWLLDRRWLLNLAGKFGADTPAAKLGPLTLAVLEGERGPAIKELRRLMRYVAGQLQPDLVSLPNLMFVGVARMMRREHGLPVVCELTGEDVFLDAMVEPYKTKAREVIRERARDVSRFVATCDEYADRMAAYLAVPRGRIDVVYPGLSKEFLSAVPAAGASVAGAGDGVAADPPRRPPTVGFLARICPEKGLDRLVEAMVKLRETPGMADARLRVAGYLGRNNRPWFEGVEQRVAGSKLAGAMEYVGEVDRDGKIDFLRSIDVLSVPTAFKEAKGIYLLEAWACGVPVVQPAQGSFPELVGQSGGGLLVAPDDPAALAAGLASLLADGPRRRELGSAGRAAVFSHFTDERMAEKMLAVYQKAITMSASPSAIPDATPSATNEDATTAPASAAAPEAPAPSRVVAAAGGGLEVVNLVKEYPTPAEPLVVLRGVSLSLAGGQSLAIVGPSGSGKSTLLNVLGTLDRPTRGTVRLAGTDPFALPDAELAHFRGRRIGFVFQDHHLLPQCTALENVLVAQLAVGKANDASAARARELLGRVGLEKRLDHLPAELSGGERQRVAIARALMNRPALLLCDEPTGNLDAANARAVGDLLREMARASGAMLVAVTHSAELAATFDRQLRMSDGALV